MDARTSLASLDDFDEASYLEAFPDICEAVGSGEWNSALNHLLESGEAEERLGDRRYRAVLASHDTPTFPGGGIDAVFATESGRCMVLGWIHDAGGPLHEIALLAGGELIGTSRQIARCRRLDAEKVVATASGKLLGFWSVFEISRPGGELPAMITLFAGRERRAHPVTVHLVDESRLREVALEYLAAAQYFANRQVESCLQIEGGIGRRLIELNREISRRVVSSPFVQRHGPQRAKFEASIVVCLFGRPEFLFLQAALYAQAPGIAEYEFVYVSNSPELAEQLMKEATMASRIYGTTITLVILPANAGFSAANNIAVEFARSGRILFINPDVFPRDDGWAAQHTAMVGNLPAEQVALFGVPLFYDDGSLMHGGMFIDADLGLAIRQDGIEQRELLRVEHYGKGAPPDSPAYHRSRAVPAVTGAFISADRAWFERLEGFSLDYIFGHYEDADLCLRSLAAGRPSWIHPLPFWHLEGKGSTRRPLHEGGTLVNRWHFTATWAQMTADGLRGPNPSRLIQT